MKYLLVFLMACSQSPTYPDADATVEHLDATKTMDSPAPYKVPEAGTDAFDIHLVRVCDDDAAGCAERDL